MCGNNNKNNNMVVEVNEGAQDGNGDGVGGGYP